MSSEILLYLNQSFPAIIFPNNAVFGDMKIHIIPNCSSQKKLHIKSLFTEI